MANRFKSKFSQLQTRFFDVKQVLSLMKHLKCVTRNACV